MLHPRPELKHLLFQHFWGRFLLHEGLWVSSTTKKKKAILEASILQKDNICVLIASLLPSVLGVMMELQSQISVAEG